MTHRVALPVLAIALAASSASAANPRAAAVLEALPFSAGERRQILAGELITTTSREQTSDRELAITMAFLVRDPPADLVDQFTRATGYDTDSQARAFGALSGDGTVAELQNLRLGDAEARRFAAARPGTDLNLSAAEIAALQALPDHHTAAVEAAVRDLLLERYRAYRARGLAGIAPYDRGGGKQSDPAAALRGATTASPVLAREAPEVVQALLEYPGGQPAGARDVFLWVAFDIDKRPTLSLTHRIVAPQSDGTYVLVDRHYYVSRSHDAVQIVAGIFPVAEGALVIYANRTFTDQLGGFGAGAKQAIGRRLMSGQLAKLYDQIRAR